MWQALVLTNRTDQVLASISTAYDELVSAADDCQEGVGDLLDTQGGELDSLTDQLRDELDSLVTGDVEKLASDVSSARGDSVHVALHAVCC